MNVEKIMKDYDDRFNPGEDALKNRMLMICNSLNANAGYMMGIPSRNSGRYARTLLNAQEMLMKVIGENPEEAAEL